MSDVRDLMGRYAAGELTEGEKRLLFEAALGDQELFEELAGEHELKQLLDQQGVKPSLIAALTPRPKPAIWSWRWVAATSAAAAAVLLGVLYFRPPGPRQMAEVKAPVAVSAQVPRLEPPPASEAAPVATAKARPGEPTAAIPAASPALPEAPPQLNSPTPPAPQSLGAPAVTALRSIARTTVTDRFGFDYEVAEDRKIRVTTASSGFLSVNAAISGASPQIIVANQPSQAGSTSELDIPARATLVTVVFSAQPVAQETQAGAIGGALDARSGTKTDPNPTANSRVTAVIPVNPQ